VEPSAAAQNGAASARANTSSVNALGATDVPQADGDEVRPQACSAVGMVRAKWISDDHYELRRTDIASIVNALRERAKTGNDEQLAPTTTSAGSAGLKVLGVGSKAECGLQSGDILLKVNDIAVVDSAALAQERERISAGKTIELTLERDGATKVITYDVRD